MLQVHQQEGEIVEHVDAGDGIVELDGIEQPRPPVEEHDIAQMQIAVAEALQPGPGPHVQQRGMALQVIERGSREAGRLRRCEEIAAGREFLVVFHHHPLDGPGAPELGGVQPFESRRRMVVEGGDGVGQVVDDPRREAAGRGEFAEQPVLCEARHDQHPLHRLTRSIERQTAFAIAGDGNHFAVKRRCRPRIQRQFPFAGPPPFLQGREIHVGVAYGALDLVGPLAGQEHQGAVGLDALDLCGLRVVAGRVA